MYDETSFPVHPRAGVQQCIIKPLQCFTVVTPSRKEEARGGTAQCHGALRTLMRSL